MTTTLTLPATTEADFTTGEVYFIGNATTLIRFGGLTLLTDPAFMHKGEYADLGHGIYARREVEPACQVSNLPPLDLVVLSHYHGDHFDDAAARGLDRSTPVVTTGHAVAHLRERGFGNGQALDTWEALTVAKGDARLKITAMPAKHASDENLLPMLMPVNGSLLDYHRGANHLFRLYVTGDTMLHDRLRDIPLRFPGIDLALVHAGGTTLFITVVTMTGAQAVNAVEMTKPKVAIPIHYNDFSVFMSGLEDVRKAAASSSTATRFHYLAHGETYQFTSRT